MEWGYARLSVASRGSPAMTSDRTTILMLLLRSLLASRLRPAAISPIEADPNGHLVPGFGVSLDTWQAVAERLGHLALWMAPSPPNCGVKIVKLPKLGNLSISMGDFVPSPLAQLKRKTPP